ncbi:Retrovirus-related Pol polyprotein from transposon TNT 1-94 [Gossypium australe]|uniref:Retrovirus-related Pol polyprotein from transposon TNT 1-94 n=1 Tax=Gossypium australe TaxID=47621 RepID=A0A5B6WUZ4_9ROSI|nr:Retrovirus-related Pol polyprotein from transposon TNT 1-94 [Gossypium australe]
MRQEGSVEGALLVKHQDDGKNRRSKNKKFHTASREIFAFRNKSKTENRRSRVKKDYPPCQHCDKKGHAPFNYSTVAKAYKIFQPQSRKTIISRYVHFMGNEQWNWDEKSGQSTIDLKLKFPVSTTDKDENWLNELVDDAPTRGTRLLTDIYARCNVAVCELADFATSIKDIKWVVAMKEELFMIEKNKTRELVDRPYDRKVVGVKWVYRTKLNVDGSINKHRARLKFPET